MSQPVAGADRELGPSPAGPGLETRPPETPARAPAVPLNRHVPFSALRALFSITVARQLRGRRLLILALLFALPTLIAVLAHRYDRSYDAQEVETILVLGMIPQALVPLTALLLASGMVQDDLEEQTLTYLLIRPIPRWTVYLVKLAATWWTTTLIAGVFTVAATVAVHWGTDKLDPPALAIRSAVFAGLGALSLLAYSSLFGLLSMLLRRSLVVGVVYIFVFEGVLANVDFVVRRATVMYQVRVLGLRWLGLPGGEWSIDPETASSVESCLMVILAVTSVSALAGAWLFSQREFRVKTPEAG